MIFYLTILLDFSYIKPIKMISYLSKLDNYKAATKLAHIIIIIGVIINKVNGINKNSSDIGVLR
jgi:hypothetical protein